MTGTDANIADQRDTTTTTTTTPAATPKKAQNWGLLLLYCLFAGAGSVGVPFLQRVYYMQGGSLKWFSGFLQSIGFPVVFPPLIYLYVKSKLSLRAFLMDLKLFLASAFIGLMLGLINFLFTTGVAYLPVSTTSLLTSTQLAFTAFFAYILVKEKLTSYSVNSVVVITMGAIVLGLHTGSDRPPGVTNGEYLMGFFFILGGAALGGLNTPLIELAYRKTSRTIDLSMLLQVQVVTNVTSALFCAVGMLINNNEFKAIPNEAKGFGIGEGKYIIILTANAIVAQLTFLGGVGIIMCRSSFFLGVYGSALLPVIQLLSVVTFHEKFTGEKGLSLALCLWGFASYFRGEFKKTQEATKSNHIVSDDPEDNIIDERRTDLEQQN